MAHDGTGAGWDVTSPADSEGIKDGAKEIRDLRKGVAARANKEHETAASSSAGGEHKKGSARAYVGTRGSTTLRPDGVTALGASDDGRIIIDSGTIYYWNGSAWTSLSTSGTRSVAILQDVKSSGTHGGASSSGWNTRTITTEVSDSAGIVSLSSNKFTPVSGTFFIKASAPFFQCSACQIRLRNVTAGTTTLVGRIGFSSSSGSYADAVSELEGVFTANGTDQYEIQYRVETTGTDTRSLGRGASFSENSVFTSVSLEKIG